MPGCGSPWYRPPQRRLSPSCKPHVGEDRLVRRRREVFAIAADSFRNELGRLVRGERDQEGVVQPEVVELLVLFLGLRAERIEGFELGHDIEVLRGVVVAHVWLL